MSLSETAATGRALGSRRWLLWGLMASLALNGFLIGAVASGYFSGSPERRGMLYMETRAIGLNLSEAEAEALRGSVRELIPELRNDWRRLRELRREINTLAAAPEPDRTAIDARLAEVRDITRAMQESVQSRVFDEVLALPPEARARATEND
jgi:uncharacterized membrane protein